MISNSSMHFQAHQEAISRPMRRNLSFTASIAHLLQPQLHHRIVRNLTTAITITTTTTTESQQQRKSKTSKRLRKTPTQKVLREESSAKWLSSLSFDDCGRTAGLQTKEVVTGLELCAAADGLLQNEEVPQTECWVLGIDPDNGGALAMLKLEDSASPAQVYDVPTVQVLVGKRARRRLDTRSIVSLLCDLGVPKGSPAYIEESRPFPSDGKQGWWSCGFGYGLWIGILVSLGFSVIPIPSMVWKKHFDLAGRTSCKDDSRVIACDLFPDLSAQLKRKKDHGRAEALLIASYGRELFKMSKR